jgi:hypothetical protein
MRQRLTLIFISLFFLSSTAIAQFGKLPPFQLQLEAIKGTNIPGMHSFAFAQSGDKLLFIGGRTNGLHGLNNNDGFPGEHKNDNVVVIDTTTWNFYQADLNQLPKSIADPMRSTNMQYIQDSDYLYMIGGYGWDSIQEGYVTYSTLTAVHINKMIDAVVNAKPIAPFIRQVIDTNFTVCGGDLAKIGNDYYLLFGHNFNGRYDKPGSVLFTQTYCNRIKKFNLNDNGTTITLSNFSYLVDTTNFHRRDLTTCPVVKPDGSYAIGAYGGVFKKEADRPYLEPIILSANGTTEIKTYQQQMSQYTCAVLPVYDASSKNMYTTFFGGISLHDYDAVTGLIKQDTLLPFINDVTTLTAAANGDMEETVLPLQLPGLLGCNAKFIINRNTSLYSNEVVDLKQLTAKPHLVGYIIGGIHAQKGNFGISGSNTSIFRVYLTPVPSVGIDDETSIIQHFTLFPNPATQHTVLEFTLKHTDHVKICLTDLAGKELQIITDQQLQKGAHKIPVDVSVYKTGLYMCEVQCTKGKRVQKLVVRKD